MSRIARYVALKTPQAWLVVLGLALGAVVAVTVLGRYVVERTRLSQLDAVTARHAVEVNSFTMGGKLMGALTMLGLNDPAIKEEALGKLAPYSEGVSNRLESIRHIEEANGAFVVSQEGVIQSSFNDGKKTSSGSNVKFRPYFQMALQGRDSIYAAVGSTTGKRTLYYAVPLRAGDSPKTPVIGAVVARNDVESLEKLLAHDTLGALLVSPQGVVYASNNKTWIGMLANEPTVERMGAIREHKQFGNMFDLNEPARLPFSTLAGIHAFDGSHFAVSVAKVGWNDPLGEWNLVMMEDLSVTAPLAPRLNIGLFAGVVVLLMGALVIHLLRGRHRQAVSAQKLHEFSEQQHQESQRKAKLAGAAIRMQHTRTLAELIPAYLSEVHRVLNVLQGVVYVLEDEDTSVLRLAGSYACSGTLPATVAIGEGLLGQCALERRMQLVHTAPEGFASIRSGLGESEPVAMLIAPLMLNDRLLGVVEVALLEQADTHLTAQFEELNGLVALNLEILGRKLAPAQALEKNA